ncbi:Wings apart-like protein heterochromatin [Rhizoctonia solani]|uniref:Wings apart-like protein heterochromatin n=1 Tax=Rhizoctonia solani TaxID=456999 RepID=A0A8H7H236_9AGAM|nr:Wings apart-like protein heterochromatin [Rhizoctonia solani]
MPVTSRSTKRKKPPRIDSDQSSNESTASDDEKRGLPPKVARSQPTLESTPSSARTPQSASISRRMKPRGEFSRSVSSNTVLGSGSRTATPPRDKEDSQRDSASTPNLGSQSQSNKHDTPSQTKKSIEGSMSTASATLGMSAPRRTYSQVRSFLAPIEDLDPDLNSSTLSIPRLTSTQSYNDLLQSESQEELQQDTSTKNITFNGETDLRSITEMRVKGESRRFGDDIEYVLEGLEDESGVKVRRASAVEFVTRMHEKGFVLRARASDVLGRAWRAIHQSVLEAGDRVFDAIAAIFICLVARELQDVAGALQDSKLPSTFCFILNRARDFDGLEAAASDSSWAMYADVAKRAGVGKVERKQLCALLGLCQNIKLTPTGQVVTTRLLISHGMSLLVPRPTTRSLLLDIIASTSAYMDVFDTRLLGYSTGLNVLPPSGVGSLHLLQFMSNLLRSCQFAIDQYEPSDEDEESGLLGKEVEEFSNRVATLCRVCQILMTSDPEDLESGVSTLSGQCALGCLKTLVLLTSDLPHQSSQDAEPGTSQMAALVARNPLNFHIITHFVAKGGDPSTQSTQFEHACLGLALLLNLVKEGSVGVKQVRSLRIYSSCPLNRKCSTECQCKNRKPLLNLYVGMYGQLQNESALQADFHATFLAGYLAVLLGLLVVNDESVKDGVYEELPGPAGSNKFEDLAQSIEQFVHAYEKVAQATKIRTNRDEEDDDNNDDNEDKEVGGGDAGSGIALGVAKRLREIS